MRISRLLLATLAIAMPASAEEATGSTEAAAVVLDSARTYQPAKVVKRKAPSYPGSALSRGREAWVYLAYCIDESGQPQNISVLDAAGDARFERAAIDAVKRWQFEPALIDGKPSWQSRNQQYILFAIDDGELGATRPFIRRYKKLGKLIDEDKLDEADALFDELLASDRLNLYELGKLWEQRVRYELKTGDMLRLDLALRRAAASNGQWIEAKSYERLLAISVKVQINLGHYPAATKSYGKLVESAGEDSPLVRDLVPLMDQVTAALSNGSVLQINGEIREKGGCNGCNDSYAFTPAHRAIALDAIDGTVDSIEMRCDHRHFESDVSELVEWRIPDEWGACHVQIRGEPGTTFKILMFPDA